VCLCELVGCIKRSPQSGGREEENGGGCGSVKSTNTGQRSHSLNVPMQVRGHTHYQMECSGTVAPIEDEKKQQMLQPSIIVGHLNAFLSLCSTGSFTDVL